MLKPGLKGADLGNAGHNAPLLFCSGSTTCLEATSLPPGLFAAAQHEVRTNTIPSGATLLLFTDGLTHSILEENPQGRLRCALADKPGEATPDTPGQPNDGQVRSMLRKLIAERFMLAVHHEKKEMSIYAITVAKSGPKLTKTQFSGALPF